MKTVNKSFIPVASLTSKHFQCSASNWALAQHWAGLWLRPFNWGTVFDSSATKEMRCTASRFGPFQIWAFGNSRTFIGMKGKQTAVLGRHTGPSPWLLGDGRGVNKRKRCSCVGPLFPGKAFCPSAFTSCLVNACVCFSSCCLDRSSSHRGPAVPSFNDSRKWVSHADHQCIHCPWALAGGYAEAWNR